MYSMKKVAVVMKVKLLVEVVVTLVLRMEMDK
jgi:hypothetical protein